MGVMFERLLRKYIEHVENCAGTDYTAETDRQSSFGLFTDEEWEALTMAGKGLWDEEGR